MPAPMNPVAMQSTSLGFPRVAQRPQPPAMPTPAAPAPALPPASAAPVAASAGVVPPAQGGSPVPVAAAPVPAPAPAAVGDVRGQRQHDRMMDLFQRFGGQRGGALGGVMQRPGFLNMMERRLGHMQDRFSGVDWSDLTALLHPQAATTPVPTPATGVPPVPPLPPVVAAPVPGTGLNHPVTSGI